jgi:hypothetical protein
MDFFSDDDEYIPEPPRELVCVDAVPAQGLFWDNAKSRLGLGTNDPKEDLDVLGTVRAGSFKGNGAGLVGLSTKQLSGTIAVATGGTGRAYLEPHRVLVGAGGSAVESAQGLFWDNGRLGVGLEDPQETLDVRGTVRADTFDGPLDAAHLIGTISPDRIPVLDVAKLGTGVLPVVHGGTGLDYAEPGRVLYGNGTDALAVAEGVRITGDGQDVRARTFLGNLSVESLTGTLPVSSGGTGLAAVPEGRVLFGGPEEALKTTSNLTWDNATACLGIRRANPAEALDVAGTIRAETFAGSGSGLSSVPVAALVGTLPVSLGGTGKTSLPAGRILVGNDVGPIGSASGLFWNNVHGCLGVRNANPEEALDVSGCIKTIDLKVANEIVSGASDLRLKQNVCRIERPLDLLDKISGYTFDWNAKAIEVMDPRHPKGDIGLIAQEIESVVPTAVYPCAFDKDYKTVKYEKLVPLLIECIKELRSELICQKTNSNVAVR